MSDSSALRLIVDNTWRLMNIPMEWNGYTFTFGQMLVLFIAVTIVVLIIKFFA